MNTAQQPTLEQLTERIQQLEHRLTTVVIILENVTNTCGKSSDQLDIYTLRREICG